VERRDESQAQAKQNGVEKKLERKNQEEGAKENRKKQLITNVERGSSGRSSGACSRGGCRRVQEHVKKLHSKP
jgi:hypothetical protein